MSLLSSELDEIRWLMGYPMLTTGAEPYVGIAAAFDIVIQPYLRAGATTTSATAVTAATTPTPFAITLTDPTGFHAGDRIIVDVDDRQESVVAQSLSGASLTLHLAKAHSGTYPVTVEGGEAVVREILRKARAIRAKMEGAALSGAGVKKVDEIEFFGPLRTGTMQGGGSIFQALSEQLQYWADEMTFVTGLANMRRLRKGGGGSMSCY